MADQAAGGLAAFLKPGELFTSEGPARIKTVLGSCLGITIRAPRLGFAAIAHCLLPHAGASLGAITHDEALRYVDTTLEIILAEFAARGAALEDMEVKLFGGSDGLAWSGAVSGYRVGSRNVEAAKTILAAHALRVAARDVGGSRGRVIEFDTETGDVLVKTLPQALERR